MLLPATPSRVAPCLTRGLASSGAMSRQMRKRLGNRLRSRPVAAKVGQAPCQARADDSWGRPILGGKLPVGFGALTRYNRPESGVSANMSIIRRLFGTSASDVESKTFAIDPSTLAAARHVAREGHCGCLASRTKKGTPGVPNLHADAQDITASGWHLLLELVGSTRAASSSAFEPLATIPADQWSAVTTLPPSISDLKTVTTLRLYGSHLRRLPPEVGRMTALSNLDV